MSKKILSLILAAAMLLGVLVLSGCTLFESQGVQESDSRLPTTLNMVGITEKTTTAEATKAVEAAINKITVAKYETKINLTLVTEEEYLKLVDSRVNEAKYLKNVDAAIAQYNKYAEREAADAQRLQASLSTKKVGKWKRAQMTVTAETVSTRPVYTAEETSVDEGGIISIVYPEASSPIDIMMISGKDMYDHFDEKSYLTSLTSLIASGTTITNFQKLAQYIYPTLMSELTAITSDTKAIPTNNLLAEYTYLVVNRELADKYGFNIDLANNYSDLSDFLKSVKENESVTPFADVPEALGIFYPFGEDVAIASYIDPIYGYNPDEGKSFSISNLFDIPQYTNHLSLISEYKSLGYFEKSGDGFAVAAVKGDASVEAEYGDDYYVKVIQNPFVEETAIFDGMMAVSSYTSSAARSLEMIQAFNTEPALKNLLQYGIEGVNYSLNADKLTIKRLNSDYMMDTKMTGNVYMGYPEEEQRGDLWSYYKQTNLASSLSPLLIYYINDKTTEDQIKDVLRRAVLTDALANVNIKYDDYMAAAGTDPQAVMSKTLRIYYSEYLMQCLRDEGVEEKQQMLTDQDGKIYYKNSLLLAVENSGIYKNDWYIDKIVEKEITAKYSKLITSAGLTTLTQEKIASITGVSYAGEGSKTYTAYKKAAQTYYTNIAYLRIMAGMLVFGDLSDEELDVYNKMTDAEYEQMLLAYVTKTYIEENNLSDEKYDELVKNYISSMLNFSDNLGNAYTVSWAEVDKAREDAKPYEEAVLKLTEEYADLLSANYFDLTSASSTPVAIAEKIHELLYRQYLKDNGVSMADFQNGIYDEILAPYGITKAELDSMRNKNKNSYESYISKLKSKYKTVLVETYSIEEYKESGTYALTSTKILSAILNDKIEEKTQIYHDMCDKAGIGYARFKECKVYMENYIKYVNMMKTKNTYTLTSEYSQTQINRFKYDEIQQIVYDNVKNVGYYTNEMVKLVGSSLSDYMKAKSDATNYRNAITKLITHYESDIKALGYDIAVFSNLNPEDIEDVIFGIIEEECKEGMITLEDSMKSASEKYLDGIASADDVKAYCKQASTELGEDLLFDSIVKTFNAALKKSLSGEEAAA